MIESVEERQTSVLATVPKDGLLPKGITPSVILENPKYAHNVGHAVRALASFGLSQLWITGDRVPLEPFDGYRLPREERFKGYRDVSVYSTNRPFDAFERGTPIIGIELVENAMPLTYFEHPDNAVYVFGPEDGSLSKTFRSRCYQILFIPTKHCLNLAVAIGTVLWDRHRQLQLKGEMPVLSVAETLEEERGWI